METFLYNPHQHWNPSDTAYQRILSNNCTDYCELDWHGSWILFASSTVLWVFKICLLASQNKLSSKRSESNFKDLCTVEWGTSYHNIQEVLVLWGSLSRIIGEEKNQGGGVELERNENEDKNYWRKERKDFLTLNYLLFFLSYCFFPSFSFKFSQFLILSFLSNIYNFF